MTTSTTTTFTWVGHWDPFSFLPFWALKIAVFVLSSGQSGLTKLKILQIIFGGDLWPTQLCCTQQRSRRLDARKRGAKRPRISSAPPGVCLPHLANAYCHTVICLSIDLSVHQSTRIVFTCGNVAQRHTRDIPLARHHVNRLLYCQTMLFGSMSSAARPAKSSTPSRRRWPRSPTTSRPAARRRRRCARGSMQDDSITINLLVVCKKG